MKIEAFTGLCAKWEPLGSWTDLKPGETAFVYNGVPYIADRAFQMIDDEKVGGDLWEVRRFLVDEYPFEVCRGAEGMFYAGPTGWDWIVSSDIAETIAIVRQRWGQ